MSEWVRYKYATVQGLSVFYREAGSPSNPALVLLHGFPSSSHMFRELLPLLADRFYLIAPDYPGFGYSNMPSISDFSYTFEQFSLIIEQLLDQLSIPKFILYCHDYGGPVGFRLAVRHPHRVRGFIIQNSVVNFEGLGTPFDVFKALWKHPDARTQQEFAATVTSFDFTKKQYFTGACYPERVSPDGPYMDQMFLNRPGNQEIQVALGYDYRKNVEQYPIWQQYLRTYQPPVLVVWGRNDFIFTLKGAEFFERELKCVATHLLCGGHFVLEEASYVTAMLIKNFFDSTCTDVFNTKLEFPVR
ncbi:alpha/beta hydrolase [Paenibacillus sp. KQZ6P-2]|uniref:Alpha/beta hydrolase n=1 Tax=Paenibacillus mangrovi TaxID=2931978 RepID=A0A9X2B3J0_9BACL|nr:alpha/beta hydrolase [Paenibacillus mangrovi]MCJ8013005.1 alpha/beta hydrolase [Paenibacillus mangrovi]